MPFQEIADFQEPIRLHNAHPEDTIREGDAVVLVLGLAGSGKSTFINTIFGQEIAKVGHDLDPGTTVPEYYTLRRGHPKNPTERHIHIIDTPGLDAGYVESAEALTAIRDWLVKRFQHIRVDGIVFLHAITQGRQADIVPHRLELFYTLCRGNRALRLICGAESIVVATTKWIEIKPEKGLAREDQLREECWKDLLNRDGTSMCRFEDSQASAISIVSDIINVAQTPRCVPPLGGSATLALDKGHILRILAIRNLFRILSILRSI